MTSADWIVLVRRPPEQHRVPLAVGPFRDEGRAQAKAQTIDRALARIGLEGYTVSVEPLEGGRTAAREIADYAR
jgi:hypothetical protein